MKVKFLLVFALCFVFLSAIPVSAITPSDAEYPVSTLATNVSTYDDLISTNSQTDFLFNYYLSHTQFPLNDFFIIRSNQYEYLLVSFNMNSQYAYTYFLNYTNGYDSSYIINESIVSFSDVLTNIDFNHFFLCSTTGINEDFEIRSSSYINMMREDNIYLCYLFILILFIFYVFRIKYNPHKKVLS